MEGKSVKESLTILTEIVLPNDTNNLDTLYGGKVLSWMDNCGAIAAARHSAKVAVTAAVDNVSFEVPIRKGHVVTMEAKVTRVFNTSMEVNIKVWAEDLVLKEKYKSNEAYYTFVTLDGHGKPVKSIPVIPESDEEKYQYERALRRRELRLILAGRMKPEEAGELKSIFIK